MMLVMGFWMFVRGLLLGSAAIALENLALRRTEVGSQFWAHLRAHTGAA
jgi:hypothetical protein